MLIPGSNEQATKRVERAAHSLIVRFPFAGLVICGQHLKVCEDESIETLCTDGKHIWYNPSYIILVYEHESLRGIEFRLLHEYMHCFFNHMARLKSRDPKIWNIAADIITNRMVEEALTSPGDKWVTPKEGISPKGFEAFGTVEEVYNYLLSHSASTPKPANPYQTKEPSGFGGADLREAELSEGELKEFHEKLSEEIVHVSAVSEMNPAVAQLPDIMKKRLDKIREGKVPWARLLSGRLLTDIGHKVASYSPPRRRLYPKVILPTYKGVRERKLLLAVDDSASVGQELHKEFQAAVLPAARHCDEIHIVTFDAVVREHVITKRPSDISKLLKYKQGRHSHTSVVGVFEIVKKVKPSAIAVLTDGYIDLPEPLPFFKKAIWCIPYNGRAQPWGRNYKMDTVW